MAMNNLGRVAMIHRGDYSPTYDYKPLDICYFDGSTYLCKEATIGNAPPNTVYWVLMSTSASTLDRDAAEAAAQAAAGSASTAANQVTLAQAQVSLAQGHATTAGNQATAAANSATAAADSAGEALASAGNAEVSASAAASYATAAEQSAAIVDMSNYALKTQIYNPNILHNWDFRNPINQRGVSGIVSAAGYFVDRWFKYAAGEIEITSAGLNCGVAIEQRIEGTWLAGQTATFSIMIGGVIYAKTMTFPSDTGSIVSDTGMPMAIIFYHDTTSMRVRLNAPPDALMYQAVKLELGTVSTLHLDPPMDHAVELPKCQRFFQVIDNQSSLYGFAVSTTSIYATIPLTMTMRALPTLSHTDATMRANGAVHTGTASPTAVTDSGLRITITGTGFPNAHVITGRIGPSSGVISLSADL